MISQLYYFFIEFFIENNLDVITAIWNVFCHKIAIVNFPATNKQDSRLDKRPCVITTFIISHCVGLLVIGSCYMSAELS